MTTPDNANDRPRPLLPTPATRLARFALAVIGLLVFWPTTARADEPPTADPGDNPLSKIDRWITKEPNYKSKPRYALLALGIKADSLVWLVEDGMSIYIDRNANGDLTDDGPPLQPQKMDKFGSPKGQRWQCEYQIGETGTPGGSRCTDFKLLRWNYVDPEDQFGLSLKLDGKTPMYAGWTPIWAESPQKASIIHFGGPLQPRLLRFKELVVDSGVQRLSIAFINPGLGERAHARLSMYALPEDVIPKVRIRWPVAKGAAPLETTYLLKERCCYWEYYDSKFKIPASAVEGTAILTVEIPDGKFPLELSTNKIEFPVVATATPGSERD
jgi:hypothetical protein